MVGALALTDLVKPTLGPKGMVRKKTTPTTTLFSPISANLSSLFLAAERTIFPLSEHTFESTDTLRTEEEVMLERNTDTLYEKLMS